MAPYAAFVDKPNAVFIPPNYEVRVLADRVKIVGSKGTLRAPSASLEIVARALQCDAPSCVIDVSGEDAPTEPTKDPAANGNQQVWPKNGSNGKNGE